MPKFKWNFFFCRKILWKVRKVSARDWMQLTLHILSSNFYWDAIQSVLGQGVRKRNTRALRISGCSIIFAKISPAQKFYPPKVAAPVIYDVARAAKQILNGCHEYAYRKCLSKLKNAMGNECQICFEKFQISPLFPTTSRIISATNITAHRSTEWCSID